MKIVIALIGAVAAVVAGARVKNATRKETEHEYFSQQPYYC